MRIYVIRHGEAIDDTEDCYGGIADFELTPNGRQQATDTAGRLRSAGIERIFSSPLKRALHTAEIISHELNLPMPSVKDDLQERNSYGVLSGVNKERAKDIFGHILMGLKEKPGYSKEHILGCEPWDQFALRVSLVFHAIVQETRDESTIAIATHGKFSQCLFDDVLNIPEKINLKLSAVNLFEYRRPVASLVHI